MLLRTRFHVVSALVLSILISLTRGGEIDIERNVWIQQKSSPDGPQGIAGASMSTWYIPTDDTAWMSEYDSKFSEQNGYWTVFFLYGGMCLCESTMNQSDTDIQLTINDGLYAMMGMSGRWSSKTVLANGPGPRLLHTSDHMGGDRSQSMVVFGGIANEKGTLATGTYILSDGNLGPSKLSWRSSTSKQHPPLRFSHFSATLRPYAKKMYIFGGGSSVRPSNTVIGSALNTHDTLDLLNDTWEYDVVKDEWTELMLPQPPASCGPLPGRAAGGGLVAGTTWYIIGGYSTSNTRLGKNTLWKLNFDSEGPVGGWECHFTGIPDNSFGPMVGKLTSGSVVGGVLNLAMVDSDPNIMFLDPFAENFTKPDSQALGYCGGFTVDGGDSFTIPGCLLIWLENADNNLANTSELLISADNEAFSVVPFPAVAYIVLGNIIGTAIFGGTNGNIGFSDALQIYVPASSVGASDVLTVARQSYPPLAPIGSSIASVSLRGENVIVTSNGRGGSQELLRPTLWYLNGFYETKSAPFWSSTINEADPSNGKPYLGEVVQYIAQIHPTILAVVTRLSVYTVDMMPACVVAANDHFGSNCSPFWTKSSWTLVQDLPGGLEISSYNTVQTTVVFASSDIVAVMISTTSQTVLSVEKSKVYTIVGDVFEWSNRPIVSLASSDGKAFAYGIVSSGDLRLFSGSLQLENTDTVWRWTMLPSPSNMNTTIYTGCQSTLFLNSWYTFGGVDSLPAQFIDYSPNQAPMYGGSLPIFGGSQKGLLITRATYDSQDNSFSFTNVSVSVNPTVVGWTPNSFAGASSAKLAPNQRDLLVVSLGGFNRNGFQTNDGSVATLYLTCNPGYFSTNFSATACKPCSKTMFQYNPGSTTCRSCPNGTTTSFLGATNALNCSVCVEGYCSGHGTCSVTANGGGASCDCEASFYGVTCSEQVSAYTIPLILVGVIGVVGICVAVYLRWKRPVKTFHVFISYRVATEAALAREVVHVLNDLTVESDMFVVSYLDQKDIHSGSNWEESFLNGLNRSCMFVPLISAAGIQPIENVSMFDDKADNLLLEYETALRLHSKKQIGIYPLLVGTTDNDGNYVKFAPENFDVSRFPNGPSKTNRKAAVRETMRRLFKIQGDFISPEHCDHGCFKTQAVKMVAFLQQKVWKSKDVDCLKLHRYWTTDSSISLLQMVSDMFSSKQKSGGGPGISTTTNATSSHPPWERRQSLTEGLLSEDQV
eukprot:m.68693 g.68693  ORF g.68693 m.68693 type:complete len:1221 (-) comp23982_c0_seq1:202-3864(-)